MKNNIFRTTLITLTLAIALSPLIAYALTTTLGANQFDCVPQRFRQPNHQYSATYDILAPNGAVYHHLDAPGLGSPTMIQT